MFKNDANVQATDDEIIDVVDRVIAHLYNGYGIDVYVEYSDRRGSNCICRFRPNEKDCTLVFGLPCMRSMMQYGTYHGNQYRLNMRGFNALVDIAAHEYAHAVIRSLDMRVKGEMHGSDWKHYFLTMIKDLSDEF